VGHWEVCPGLAQLTDHIFINQPHSLTNIITNVRHTQEYQYQISIIFFNFCIAAAVKKNCSLSSAVRSLYTAVVVVGAKFLVKMSGSDFICCLWLYNSDQPVHWMSAVKEEDNHNLV